MNEQRAEDYITLTRYDSDQNAVSELNSRVEELAGWYPIMPKVDEHGESECPFAESMFLKKLRLEQEVAKRMAKLQEMLPVIEEEVQRCRDNAYRASVEEERLDYLTALEHCREQLTNEESAFRSVIWRHTAIVQALAKAEATLGASREKVYPLPLSI